MISIVGNDTYISAMVMGQFTLQDYKELETNVQNQLPACDYLNLLFDLRNMTGYTVDVAVEEVRFTKAHRREFRRIAVVTDDQWVIWSAWLNRLLAEADIEVFASLEEAVEWVKAEDEAAAL